MTTTGRPMSGHEPIDRIIAEFRAGYRELRCIGSQRLLRQGVSMTHLHVLSMLERHGAMTMSRLADVIDVSLSNATGLIDRMEERGFVERERVPDDRRVVLVRVTDLGRQMVGEMEVLRDDLLQKVLARLGPEQLARLALAVEDLREAVSGVLADEPALLLRDHAAEEHAPGQRRTQGRNETPNPTVRPA